MSRRALRFGAQLNAVPSAQEWTSSVRRAEALDFDVVVVPDHLFGIAAPLTALAAAAASTDRIRLGTLLLNNDLRHPVVLAHEIATLDALSGGRVELGLGAGWNRKEYDQAGMAYDRAGVRVDRLIESVGILDRLLSGETVDHVGEHYTVREHNLGKQTLQSPRPPFVIGGNGDRVLRLAARKAEIVSLLGVTVRPDGSRDFSSFTPAGLDAKLRHVRTSAGDRADQLELSAFVWNVVPGDSAEEAAETVDRDASVTIEDVLASPFVLCGRPSDMAQKMIDLRDRLGISYFVAPPSGTEAMGEAIEAVNAMRGRFSER